LELFQSWHRSINKPVSLQSELKSAPFLAAYRGDNYRGPEPSSASDSFPTSALYKYSVASLGLVSPGAATDSHPVFFLEKTDDLFSNLPLERDDLFS